MKLRRFLIQSLLATVLMTGVSFTLNISGHAAPVQYAIALIEATPELFAKMNAHR